MIDPRKIPEWIDFMGDMKLTPSQFILCYILYLDKKEHGENPLPKEGRAIANIYRYCYNIGPWPDEEIEDLIERGYLANFNTTHVLYPDNLEVTDKFARKVFATEECFDEFWQEYPAFVPHWDNPRKKIPLKSSVRSEVEVLYNRQVTTRKEHERVMKALRWAKERGEIKMNITKYVGGEVWKGHLKQMEDGEKQHQHTVI